MVLTVGCLSEPPTRLHCCEEEKSSASGTQTHTHTHRGRHTLTQTQTHKQETLRNRPTQISECISKINGNQLSAIEGLVVDRVVNSTLIRTVTQLNTE